MAWEDYIVPTLEIAGGTALVATGAGTAPGIGLIASGATGAVGAYEKSTAKSQLPPYEDPGLKNYSKELDRQRSTYQTGSIYASEMKDLKNQQSDTQQGVLRLAGGNTGAAIAAMKEVGLNTGKAYGKVAAAGDDYMFQMNQLYYDTLKNAADRRLALQNVQYEQSVLDSRNKSSASAQTAMNILPMLKNVDFTKLFGGGGGTTTTPTSGSASQSLPTNMPVDLGTMNPDPNALLTMGGGSSLPPVSLGM